MDRFSEENKAYLDGSFKLEHLREGGHILALPLPANLLLNIGFVVLHWGTFENLFDGVISAIFVAVGKEQAGWRHESFAKRRKLFRELVQCHLMPYEPVAAEGYIKIADDAAALQRKRNVATHGQYEATLPPIGPDYPKFTAVGKHNGRRVTLDIDESVLVKLWHDIAHLSGELIVISSKIGSQEGGWPVISDSDLLSINRAYLKSKIGDPPLPQTTKSRL